MPKNLLILSVDEMRGDCLAANGLNPDIRTPHMDALVARGVNFRRHFTTFPKCVPSRVSLMTGRYPHTDGYRTIYQKLPEGTPDVASTLKEAGYETALFGKNHVWENLLGATHDPPELDPGERGMAFDHHSWTPPFKAIWDRYLASNHAGERFSLSGEDARFLADFAPSTRPDRQDEAILEQADLFLREVRDRDRRFFCKVDIGKPHPPYNVEEPYYSMYDRDGIERYPLDLPGNAPLPLRAQREVRTGPDVSDRAMAEFQAVYYGMIAKVDEQIGRIAATLDELGLWEETVVMLWSDHGDFAGQYGLQEKWDTVFSDCLLHVVCGLVAPGLPAGREVDLLSDNTDVAPTLLELLGMPALPGMHGSSMLPTLKGRPIRDAVFASGGHEDEMLGRIDPLTHHPGGGRIDKNDCYLQYPDAMARATCIRTDRWKLVHRLRGGHELYDLADDRWEMRNLWGESGPPAELRPVVLDLMDRLLAWSTRTDTDRPYQERVFA